MQAKNKAVNYLQMIPRLENHTSLWHYFMIQHYYYSAVVLYCLSVSQCASEVLSHYCKNGKRHQRYILCIALHFGGGGALFWGGIRYIEVYIHVCRE